MSSRWAAAGRGPRPGGWPGPPRMPGPSPPGAGAPDRTTRRERSRPRGTWTSMACDPPVTIARLPPTAGGRTARAPTVAGRRGGRRTLMSMISRVPRAACRCRSRRSPARRRPLVRARGSASRLRLAPKAGVATWAPTRRPGAAMVELTGRIIGSPQHADRGRGTRRSHADRLSEWAPAATRPEMVLRSAKPGASRPDARVPVWRRRRRGSTPSASGSDGGPDGTSPPVDRCASHPLASAERPARALAMRGLAGGLASAGRRGRVPGGRCAPKQVRRSIEVRTVGAFGLGLVVAVRDHGVQVVTALEPVDPRAA